MRHLLTCRPGLCAAAIAGLLAFQAVPALAQDNPPPSDEIEEVTGNIVTIGLGVGIVPDYEGSDEYKFIPGAALLGTVAGHDFFMRGTHLYVDAIPESPGQKVDFSLGPVAGVRFNRTGEVDDPQVAALGELDTAIEVGAFASIGVSRLLNDYDSLTFRLAYLHDVADAHGSHVITPTLEYGTPLNRRTYVSIYAAADFAGDDYAAYYFDVTPAGSAASGLAPFRADGGFKNWRVGILAAYSLSGKIRGPSVFAMGNYTRLQGDFARSPLVSAVGDSNQFFGAVGLAYTF